MREERCKTVDGVHIPGCMGCAVYGHRGCTCPPYSLDDRLAKIERRLKRLESRPALTEDTPKPSTEE